MEGCGGAPVMRIQGCRAKDFAMARTRDRLTTGGVLHALGSVRSCGSAWGLHGLEMVTALNIDLDLGEVMSVAGVRGAGGLVEVESECEARSVEPSWVWGGRHAQMVWCGGEVLAAT